VAAQTQTRKIVIKVDAAGVKEALDNISKSMGGISKNTKSLAGNMGFLSNAFRGWLGYLGTRELAGMSDTVQSLQNRLKITTSGADDAASTFAGLTKIANENYQSISSVGDVYGRFALSLKRVGATSGEVLALTDELIKTFRVSGSGADETANAMVQLSQAFGTGVLRGQDLRSVISQNVVIAKALQDRYGADLFKKAEAGAISISEVMQLLKGIQKEVTDNANKMAPTFAQTLTVAMNKATVAVGEFSKALNLPDKFNKTVMFILDHFQAIATLLAGAAFYSAITRIYQFVTAIQAAKKAAEAADKAFKLFSLSNPYLLVFTALATIAATVATNLERVKSILYGMGASIAGGFASLYEADEKFAALIGAKAHPEHIANATAKMKELRAESERYKILVDQPQSSTKGPLADPAAYAAAIGTLAAKAKNMVGPTKELKEQLGILNTQYLTGQISLEEYHKRLIAFDLKKINQEFKEGKDDIFKFHEQLKAQDIAEYSRQLNIGAISQRKFNEAVAGLETKNLKEQLDAGKIGLDKYYEAVVKLEDKVRPGAAFYTGAQGYLKSIGTFSQGIAKVIEQAFQHLEDTFVNFVQTGKFEFKQFAQSVLSDLTRMMVRSAIMAPLAAGLTGLIGSLGVDSIGGGVAGGSGSYYATKDFANGGIMTSRGSLPLNTYAGGGIANSPQLAMFGEGRTPEAYVPLPDGRNIPVKMDGGNGGVSISQTIIINSDGSSSENSATKGQNAKQLGDIMRQVALDTIVKEKRKGGLLS